MAVTLINRNAIKIRSDNPPEKKTPMTFPAFCDAHDQKFWSEVLRYTMRIPVSYSLLVINSSLINSH